MRSVVLAIASTFAVSSLLTTPVRAQSEAWRTYGQSSVPKIGSALAWLPDIDGDGVPDFVAGGPAEDPVFQPAGNGHVLVCSGATATILFDWVGDVGAGFGMAVARAGDANGDGIEDIAVGAPFEGNGNVFVYSGADGTLLRALSGSTAGSQFGISLASLGDVDGDGVDDFAVGAPANTSGGAPLGLAVIYSGASGAVLAQFTGTIYAQFGSVVADAGDLDRDGIHDLLVLEQANAGNGTLSVFSSVTHQTLCNWSLGAATSGWTASGAGDVNGDGIGDLIVGNQFWPVTPIPYPPYAYIGGVWVYDGATGAILYQYTTFDSVGWSVGGAGFVDHDGFADYAFALNDYTGSGIRVYSGKDGKLLEQAGDGSYTEFAGGVDATGDGVPDLLIGKTGDATNGQMAGAAGVYDVATLTLLNEAFGTSRVDLLGSTIALLDDVNGDGTRDLLVGTGNWDQMYSIGVARVLSGIDGSELRAHAGALGDSYSRSVAALPDVDGDGVGDYAITVPGALGANSGHVEIRSGATGNLMNTLAPGGSVTGTFGASCAVALQPSGAVQIAVGAPVYLSTGAVYVFDVATGNVVASAFGAASGDGFGESIAYLGDVDGDGVGDWVAGAPYDRNDHGSVVVFSGQTGATLQTISAASQAEFGWTVGGPGDLDGDGTPDLLVGAPARLGTGATFLYSGATWSRVQTWVGGPSSAFGEGLTVVGDVNRDGFDDFLVGQHGAVYLYSGGSRDVLYRFDDANQNDFFGLTGAGVAAPGSNGSMNGDAIPDVAIGAYLDSTDGMEAGRLSLYYLADLYLQIDPPTASAGQSVSLTTSGGPSGNLAALFATAFDGTPIFLLTALGTLDGQGIWNVSGPVPPGLSGHSVTFESFTVGFTGKLAKTQLMTLNFQ